MRTLARFELSLQVDTLIVTVALELCTGRFALTWSAFDAHRAEERERAKFLRPEGRPSVMALDDRARMAGA